MRDSHIHTFTGRRVNPLDLHVCDVSIEDIAHALACKARFTGHARVPYSVAEHSVRVCRLLAARFPHDSSLALAGLLHDSAEAYLCDIPSPYKHKILVRHGWFPEPWRFDELEDRVHRTILRALDLGPHLRTAERDAKVKDADLTLLATEARDLMHPGWDWWRSVPAKPIPRRLGGLLPAIHPWGWRKARRAFLGEFRRLWREVDREARREFEAAFTLAAEGAP